WSSGAMKTEVPPLVLEDWWCERRAVHARVTARNSGGNDVYSDELEINDAKMHEPFVRAAHNALQSEEWSADTLKQALLAIRRHIQDQRDAGENGSSPPDDGERSQTDKLLKLAAPVEFFHDAEQRAYALITDRGHRECHPVHSRAYELWLRQRYYKEHGKAP